MNITFLNEGEILREYIFAESETTEMEVSSCYGQTYYVVSVGEAEMVRFGSREEFEAFKGAVAARTNFSTPEVSFTMLAEDVAMINNVAVVESVAELESLINAVIEIEGGVRERAIELSR